ncbi:YibE/F family protein [Vallitalea pronyensis]|uniref:YibE/F family protein n=1 Tax=Vallitalea pronyensis TaxID=1348613 RepID=A0A8J8MLP1_9FIRM|nr:YibE/F family protein [Vallitalea pronyensis]QUI23814.1 YibE/F family protein [Vallitalea pronyensis]
MRKIYVCIIFMLIIGTRGLAASDDGIRNWKYIHARVTSILSDTVDEENYMRYQKVMVELTEPQMSGELEVENTINIATIYKIIVKPGDDVIIVVNEVNNKLENGRIYSYGRDKYLLYLLLLFMGVLILIGGKNGFYSIISLTISVCLILFVFFPLILKSINPIVVVSIISVVATLVTLTFIGGYNKKTLAAIIGTIGGVVTAGILTFWFGALTHIQGIGDDNVELLSYFPKGCKLNFRDLLYAAIIIGALGAIMDVSMSIASSMDEIQRNYPRITKKQLLRSGMHIGKDIMGTMSNTLILAYAGNSISMILVFFLYDRSFVQFINSDHVAGEILRALCGSIGLVLSIPLTSIAFISLCKKETNFNRRRMNGRLL